MRRVAALAAVAFVLPSVVSAMAIDPTVALCNDAMKIERERSAPGRIEPPHDCRQTPYDLEAWRCIVASMRDNGERFDQAAGHCGAPR